MKPMEVASLIQVIKQRVASGPQRKREIETVASILQRATESTIREWFKRIETEPTLMAIPMSCEQRCTPSAHALP